MKTTLVLFLLFGFPFAFADDASETFRISSLVGTAFKNDATAAVGTVLAVGDRLKTDEKSEAELESSDGSKLTVVEKSEVVIAFDEHAMQTIDLRSGKIVGNAVKKPADSNKTYRFLIKTKTGVMGVRGTQFVVEASEDGKRSNFYVLNGVVDVARTMGDLLTNNFVVVKAGELVEIAAEGVGFVTSNAKKVAQTTTDAVDSGVHGVSRVLPFDVLGFVADMNKKLPEQFHIPFLTGEVEEHPVTWHLSCFEIASQRYYDRRTLPTDWSRTSAGMSWNPTYHAIAELLDLRGHIGFPRLFHGAANSFDEWEFKASATYIFRKSAFVELGPDFQIYPGGKTGFGASMTGGLWFGDRPLLKIVERFFVGTNCLSSPYPACEYRIGVGGRLFR